MATGTAPQHGWRARQPTTLLEDDAGLEVTALLEAEAQPEPVPEQWEDLLVSPLTACYLPVGVLERLVHETLTDALPAIARLLERQLRLRFHREQRALRQACDDY